MAVAVGKRRWPRFSLWHILALTLVVALMLALVLNPILARRRVIRRIEQLGAVVSTEAMVPTSHLETIRYWIERTCWGSHPVDIRTLDATGCAVTDEDLKWISRLEKLRELELSFTQVTDVGVPQLEALSDLRFLNLSGTRVSGSHVEMFERMPMLRDVQLLGTQASSTESQDSVERKFGLAIYCSAAAANTSAQDVQTVFANGAQLRYFDNPGRGTTLDAAIPGETKNLVEVLSVLKNLPIGSLSVANRDFSDEEAHALGELAFETLFLANPGFRNFNWLPRVRGLRRIFYYDLRNQREFAAVLHEIPELHELSVVSSNFMPDMESLDGLTTLAASRVTDERIGWITKLPNLRSLQLIGPTLSADAYRRLADELELESLRLGDCQVSEQILAEIANMQSLRELDIDDSVSLDSAGLMHLSQLSQLTELRLWGVALGGDDQAIAQLSALARALPQCEIRTDLPLAKPKTASVVR